jgi:NAD(P)-dependent dehydrogenase (short-subunit alcohol dehydrogenase family)
MEFKNKVVIITGGSSGIGKRIAERFSKEGAKVVVSSKDEKSEGDFEFIKADVREEEAIKSLVEDVVKKYRKIDILVNSAGIYSQNQYDIINLATEEFDNSMNTNFKGTFLTTKHVLPHLLKSKGNIVNISSALGLVPEKESSIYCSSKAAVNMFTKTLALNYADQGIRINAVCPGPINTPMLDENIPADEMADYLNENPMKRAGTTDEVANLVLFLTSDEASYITGGIYTVDGGESLK